MVTYTLHSILY